MMMGFIKLFINENGDIETKVLDFKDIYVDPDYKKFEGNNAL